MEQTDRSLTCIVNMLLADFLFALCDNNYYIWG